MWVYLLLVIVVSVTTYYATGVVFKRKDRSARKTRASRASDGEDQAPDFLRSHGFVVVGRQPTVRSWIEVNGEDLPFQVRADFIVRDKYDNLFVVDVKTGLKAPNPKNIATRRQLLEYRLLYKVVSGVLLVDMETRTILHIGFPDHRTNRE